MRLELEGYLKERILILDGAMGTSIQKRALSEEDFRGHILAIKIKRAIMIF